MPPRHRGPGGPRPPRHGGPGFGGPRPPMHGGPGFGGPRPPMRGGFGFGFGRPGRMGPPPPPPPPGYRRGRFGGHMPYGCLGCTLPVLLAISGAAGITVLIVGAII